MKLSFGMIFSIILIIVFLVVAFFAIQKFMNLQKIIVSKQFIEDFQADVNQKWKSSQGSGIKTYNLHSSIISICFREDNFKNLKINYKDKYDEENIENIDIENTLQGQSEMCIEAKDSEIKLMIQKNYSEPLVTIKPAE